MTAEVILATHNVGKLEEFQQLVVSAPFVLIPYPTTGEIVEETGTSYLENARLKAHYVARTTGKPALADDSGVEVDALDGLPGLHSADFVSRVPWENSREILLRLMSTPPPRRTARMRAVLCLAFADGTDICSEGVVEGVILTWPRGRQGFGVDPIFSVDGRRSLAEWDSEQKNRISHRARAVLALVDEVRRAGLWR